MLVPQEAMWMYHKETGIEHLFITKENNNLYADGLAVGVHSNISYRVKYMIRFSKDWKVQQVHLNVSGRINNTIDKFVSEDGKWTAFFQEEETALSGCFAVEISTSPVTRSLVLRQLSLLRGETSEIRIASFDVLNLQFKPITYRYRLLQFKDGERLYQCENLSTGKREELHLDEENLLQSSPHILSRVWVA
jgi:hypothetical protein